MMDQASLHSKLGNIPFSWEKKPGVSKVSTQQEKKQEVDEQELLDDKLMVINHLTPPPPCPAEQQLRRISPDYIQIPLPPCVFQPPPPSRTSSRRGLMKKHQDPFLAAYKECTKSTNTASTSSNGKIFSKYQVGPSSRLRKVMFNLSCKSSCSVRNDNLVRVSQLPCEVDKDY